MLTRVRKQIERNKHLSLHKQTKQEDENNYRPRVRKEKIKCLFEATNILHDELHASV